MRYLIFGNLYELKQIIIPQIIITQLQTSRQYGVFHVLLQCIHGKVLAKDLTMKTTG